MLVEDFVTINDTGKSFNFLKSLDIANVNAEVEKSQPNTHKF